MTGREALMLELTRLTPARATTLAAGWDDDGLWDDVA